MESIYSLKKEFKHENEKDIPNFHRMTMLPKYSDKMQLEEIVTSGSLTEKKSKQKTEENFLKIDEKNNFEREKEARDLEEEFNEECNNDFIVKQIVNNIFIEHCGVNINNNDDIFMISQNIAKAINKIIKIDKLYIDKLIKDLVGTNNMYLYKSNNLLLDQKNCEILGAFLCYSFSDSRLQQYKIKDANKLIEIRQAILKSGINSYRDYLNYCRANPQTDIKITAFWKNQKNRYICLPSLIFLFNRYSKVKEIEFDINLFNENKNPDLNEVQILFTYLTLLNINLLLNSFEGYKINLIYKKLEIYLYSKYYWNKLYYLFKKKKENLKKNNLKNKTKIFNQKWNFKYSIDMMGVSIKEHRKKHKKIESKSEDKDKEKQIEKITSRNEYNDIEDIALLISKKSKLFEVIEKHINKLELILICFYGLINFNNYEKLEFTYIINDAFTKEYITFLSRLFSIEHIYEDEDEDYFHIFDLLINEKNKLKKLNLEINSLDNTSFKKLLNYIYNNKLLKTLNISLFTSDVIYTPQSLYKICLDAKNQETVCNNDSSTYLYNDIVDLEKNILDELSNNFIYNLSSLFEIIKNMENLEELGINMDIPSNVINNRNYKNSILKFVLNLLFLISNNNYIQKFCFLSSKTILDNRKIPFINNIMKNIDMSQACNLVELTINLQFYQIEEIGKLINTRLKILNIGYFDLNTFKKICLFLCDDNFNKESSLEKLSLGLLNTIVNFDIELKFFLRKLFSIKIKSLINLSLYTNIIIKDEIDYEYLLKILNNNWINEYLIVLNQNSNEFFQKFIEDRKNLNFYVPHSLEEKLIEPEDIIMKYQNNPAALEIGKNLDKNDDAYWYLKYLFKNKYIDELNNDYKIRSIIKGILKYLYFQKKVKIRIITDFTSKNH